MEKLNLPIQSSSTQERYDLRLSATTETLTSNSIKRYVAKAWNPEHRHQGDLCRQDYHGYVNSKEQISINLSEVREWTQIAPAVVKEQPSWWWNKKWTTLSGNHGQIRRKQRIFVKTTWP
jgi:hypothetical protein